MKGEPSPTSPLQLDVITHRREACAVGHRCRLAPTSSTRTPPGALENWSEITAVMGHLTPPSDSNLRSVVRYVVLLIHPAHECV
jgi:hypothetical protein